VQQASQATGRSPPREHRTEAQPSKAAPIASDALPRGDLDVASFATAIAEPLENDMRRGMDLASVMAGTAPPMDNDMFLKNALDLPSAAAPTVHGSWAAAPRAKTLRPRSGMSLAGYAAATVHGEGPNGITNLAAFDSHALVAGLHRGSCGDVSLGDGCLENDFNLRPELDLAFDYRYDKARRYDDAELGRPVPVRPVPSNSSGSASSSRFRPRLPPRKTDVGASTRWIPQAGAANVETRASVRPCATSGCVADVEWGVAAVAAAFSRGTSQYSIAGATIAREPRPRQSRQSDAYWYGTPTADEAISSSAAPATGVAQCRHERKTRLKEAGCHWVCSDCGEELWYDGWMLERSLAGAWVNMRPESVPVSGQQASLYPETVWLADEWGSAPH